MCRVVDVLYFRLERERDVDRTARMCRVVGVLSFPLERGRETSIGLQGVQSGRCLYFRLER